MLLYHFPEATCGCKVRLVLAEKKLSFNERILTREELAGSEYRAINKKGVVPTLEDNGEIITESSVIMSYLDDQYPENSLTPDTVNERLHMRRWMKFADDEALPALGAITYTTYLRPKFLALPESVVSAALAAITNPIDRYRRKMWIEKGVQAPDVPYAMTILADLLARVNAAATRHAWLAGGTYSMADAAVTPFFYRLDLLGLLEVMNKHHPDGSDWWQRIQARPGFETVFQTKKNPEYKDQLRAAARPHLEDLLAYLSD